MAIQPFKVEVPDSVLDDLRARLERTRWPDEMPGSDWDYGSNLDYVKEFVEYHKWLGKQSFPIYMREHFDAIPTSVPFPFERSWILRR